MARSKSLRYSKPKEASQLRNKWVTNLTVAENVKEKPPLFEEKRISSNQCECTKVASYTCGGLRLQRSITQAAQLDKTTCWYIWGTSRWRIVYGKQRRFFQGKNIVHRILHTGEKKINATGSRNQCRPWASTQRRQQAPSNVSDRLTKISNADGTSLEVASLKTARTVTLKELPVDARNNPLLFEETNI